MTQLNAQPKLPPPVARTPVHTRKVTFEGYHREDGHWDIEGRVTDTKSFDLLSSNGDIVPAGTRVHDMLIRVTVDNRMKILDIVTSIDFAPFTECGAAEAPMRQFIGLSMGPGWRRTIDRLLGGTLGCTHVRELLFNMATAAYQTIPVYQWRLRREAGLPVVADGRPPYHLGRCLAWDFNGPVVARLHPEFAGWQPLVKMAQEPHGG